MVLYSANINWNEADKLPSCHLLTYYYWETQQLVVKVQFDSTKFWFKSGALTSQP